jgi:diguanylate cyclase
LDDETLQHLVASLTKSGQAISIDDADDNLRYANETYQGMFLGGFEGPSPSPKSTGVLFPARAQGYV